MIQVENLCKSFDGFVAVDNLSFGVSAGEVLGFLGPNGAGKSTTMKMISGFIKPDSGSVKLFDKDVVANPIETKRLLGYLPEGAPAWGEMTVARFLDFIADVRGLTGSEKQSRLSAVIEQLALESVLERVIENLSKGFNRRVGIAQAIIHDPQVLILDEPTDGLDPNQKHQVRELIRNLATDKIVIISTHILEEVNAVCTRAMIIADGQLVADNSPAELERQSRYFNAVTVALSGTANHEATLADIPGVSTVEKHSTDANRYTLFPQEGVEIFPSVNEFVQSNQLDVRGLFVERGRLDDVFHRITSQHGNGAAQ